MTLDRANLKILVEYLRGPFSNLENRWTFEPKGDGVCDVGFFPSYQFKSRMLAMLMGSMFDTAFARFSAAFEKRADAIYGRPKLAPSNRDNSTSIRLVDDSGGYEVDADARSRSRTHCGFQGASRAQPHIQTVRHGRRQVQFVPKRGVLTEHPLPRAAHR